MILFDIYSILVPKLYQCHDHDEHHNCDHPGNLYVDDHDLVERFHLLMSYHSEHYYKSSFANESCWQTSGQFRKVWVSSYGLKTTRGISWSPYMSGTKPVPSSPTLSELTSLGTTKVPLQLSMSLSKSRRFHVIMELRHMSRIFCLIMKLRSKSPLACHLQNHVDFGFFREYFQLISKSDPLGAPRLEHSHTKWPGACNENTMFSAKHAGH